MTDAERRLVEERAARLWLRGDVIQAMAKAGERPGGYALSTADAAKAELLRRDDRSLGGALRGPGEFVKESAADFARRLRRPPLAERPADA